MNDRNDPSTLLAAINRFEARLEELDGGDCGYEKALVRGYEQAVAQAREQLATSPAPEPYPPMCNTSRRAPPSWRCSHT
ncbi:MAG: hypothetical protein MZV65_52320 [Chromatiales bacterium]|nr:hypothetical protein [Chromatiales bacterium]